MSSKSSGAERRDVLAAVKFFDERRERVAESDHQHDFTLVLPQNLRHERHDLVGIPDRNVESQALGDGARRLLGAAMSAGVNCIDPRYDVDVQDHVRKQLGSLAAKPVERRVDTGTRVRIRMPNENQRGGSLLFEEPRQPEQDEDKDGYRYQSRPAPLPIPRFRFPDPSAYPSTPKHIPLVAILIAGRAHVHYRVFDLDDLAGRRLPPGSGRLAPCSSGRLAPVAAAKPPDPNEEHKARHDRKSQDQGEQHRADQYGADGNNRADDQTSRLQERIS